jgi:putative PEP-CTERM system TPR-repeat lipoprotein
MKVMDLTLFKQNIFSLLLACLVVSLSACDGLGRSTEEYIEGAQAYLDQEDFSAAVVELKSALQQDANSTEARKLLGDVYLKIGKGEDAEKEIRRAISLGMSPVSGANSLAQALMLQGEFQQVLKITIDPGAVPKVHEAKLLALHGDAHLELNDLTSAEKSYDLAIGLDTSSREALTGKARLKASRGDIDSARAMAEKVAQSHPSFAPVREFLGDLALIQEQLDNAEVMYSRAIEQSHYLGMNSLKRAGVRLQQNDYPGLSSDVDALLNSGYQSPHLFYFKGRVDFFNEDYLEAEKAFKNALELSPKFWPAKVYLASTHLAVGQSQQALNLAQQLQSDAPADRLYLKGLLGATYVGTGQFDQAKKALYTLLAGNPHDVYALSLLAQIMLNEGNSEEATIYLTRALSITPESKDLQRNLKVAQMMSGQSLNYSSDEYADVFLAAMAELNIGNYKKVFDTAQSLHEQKPTLVDPLNLRAASQLGLGDLKGALKSFEQVLELEPNNPTASKNLATMEWQTGNLERAESILTGYLQAYPQDESALVKQFLIKSQLGKAEEGITLLSDALEKETDSALIRATLAQYYFDAGKYSQLLNLTSNISEQQLVAQPVLLELRAKVNLLRNENLLAQQDFKKYLSLLPESAHARFLYADILARRGQKLEARKQLESAVDVDPDYLPARIGLVKMYTLHNQLEQAAIEVEKLKKNFTETPAILALDGWLALGKGDLASAEKNLAAAIEKAPNSEVSLLLFRSLWLQGEYDRAYTVLNVRLDQRPKELPLLEELAAAYMAQGKGGEALKVYLSILKDYPNHVLALNNAAWLSREQNVNQAIDYAERARELAPRAANVADTLAMLLLQKDTSSRRALDLLQEAARQAPSDQSIQLHYAELLVQRKMYSQARGILNAVVERAPDSQQAVRATGILNGLSDSGE